jgi:hypothetical protein
VKQAIAVVLAALLVTIGAIALLAGTSDSGGSDATADEPFTFEPTTTLTPEQKDAREAADTWRSGVDAALLPLSELAGRYVSDLQSWKDGLVDDATLRASLTEWKTNVTATRINVEALEPFEDAPAAHPSYVALAALYDAAIDTSTAALDIPEGELRDQTARLANRLRILGDRAYARGIAAIDAAASRDADPEAALEDPVPDWATDDLGAGPPLEPNPPAPATVDPTEGATQPRDAWVQAVVGTGAPTGTEILDAVRDGDPETLAGLARRLDDAVAQLRVAPDPDTPDGLEESARVRIGMLALADVARLAQVAALVDQQPLTDSLRFTASSLHAIMTVPAYSPPS